MSVGRGRADARRVLLSGTAPLRQIAFLKEGTDLIFLCGLCGCLWSSFAVQPSKPI